MAFPQPMTDPTAVLGRRIGAIVIDLAIMGTLLAVVMPPAIRDRAVTRDWPTAARAESYCATFNDARLSPEDDVCTATDVTTHEMSPGEAKHLLILAASVTMLVILLNWILLQGFSGASLGKQMVGLRVIREDGRIAGFGWNLLREVLLIVDLVCCFTGLAMASVSSGHRRVGDMAASTYVVAKSNVGTPPMVPGSSGGYGAYPPPGAYGQAPLPGWGGPADPTAPGWGGPAGPGPTAWGGPPPTGPVGWGGPTDAGPSGWGGPTPSAPSDEGPTWDPARNAYIQYDRDRGEWIQWNDQAQAWGPIDQ